MATFGNTNILSDQYLWSKLHTIQLTLPENGLVTSISWYSGGTPYGSSSYIWLAIYNNSENKPTTLLANTPNFYDSWIQTGWNNIALVTPISLNAGIYWIALDTGELNIYNKVTIGGANRNFGYNQTYSEPPNPAPDMFAGTPFDWSIYATYTPVPKKMKEEEYLFYKEP